MAETWYPPAAFYFGVVVGGSSPPSGSESPALDASFQEVSGLRAEVDVDEVPEGGENRYVHRLPGRVRYPNLVLKRGLVLRDSFLAAWAAETMGLNYVRPVETRTLMVRLFGKDNQPLVNWQFERAYPVRWELGSLDSTVSTFAVETLEPELLGRVPDFERRMKWFLDHRRQLAAQVSRWQEPGVGGELDLVKQRMRLRAIPGSGLAVSQ